jgi:hypothetical protein
MADDGDGSDTRFDPTRFIGRISNENIEKSIFLSNNVEDIDAVVTNIHQ